MSENKGLPTSQESNFDLDAIIKADEEDKKKEDALLTSNKRQEGNKKKAFIGVLSLALVGVVASLFIFKPFGLIDDEGDGKKPAITATATPSTSTNQNQAPGPAEPNFWDEKGKQYPVKLQDWQLKPDNAYRSVEGGEAAQSKAQQELINQMGAYNLSIPGVNSNLQTLPSRSNGFTDDPKQVTLPDGNLNPKYTYWTLEGFNENVNGELQRFINPVFGRWSLYQYSSAKDIINKDGYLNSLFQARMDPEFIKSVKGKPLSSWLPVFADWNSNDYGMGDKLLANGGPRWMGSLDNVETTFKFDEATQTYKAHVKANVTYVAWSQSQETLKKTGVITFDVLPGKEGTNVRYMLSNTKLEMTA